MTNSSKIEYPDVTVKLIGQDGNVFGIIWAVSGALKKAGYPDAAKEFINKAFSAPSYDEVLSMVQQLVNVE